MTDKTDLMIIETLTKVILEREELIKGKKQYVFEYSIKVEQKYRNLRIEKSNLTGNIVISVTQEESVILG